MQLGKRISAWMAVGLAIAMTIGVLGTSFISLAATATVNGGEGVTVNVRSRADAASSIVGKVSGGETFEVGEPETDDKGDSWYRITLANGREGYIREDFLTIEEEAGAEDPEETADPEGKALTASAGSMQPVSAGSMRTVSVQYFSEEDASPAAGTAELVTDAKGHILSAIFYDEEGNFIFRADYDGEAAASDGPTAVWVRDLEEDLTAEEVAGNVVEAMTTVDSIAFESKAVFLTGVSAQGISMDMEMNISINAEMTDDPRAAHMLMALDVSVLGESMVEEMEMYAVPKEDGGTVTYTRESTDGETGEWEVSEDDSLDMMEGGLFVPTIYEKIADGRIEADLSDEVVSYNGIDCYRLDFVLQGEDLSSMSSYMMTGGSETGLLDTEGMDLETMEAPVTAFVNADDFTLAGMWMDCRPMAEAMMEELMGMDGEEVSLDVRQFDMEIVYTGYDVDEITPPEE